MIKRSSTDNAFSLFLGIMRNPRIHSMELQPEDTSISSEKFTHCHSLHFIEIINSFDSRSKSCAISFCDIGNLCDYKSFKYFFNFFCIKFHERSEWFPEISEHLCSYASICNTYRNRYSYIPIDFIFYNFCEFFIVSRHSCNFNKKFINRKNFYLSESPRKISHQSFRYLPIPRMIRIF